METYLHSNLTKKIIGLAIKVHNELGSGYPEKIYQRALYLELKRYIKKFEREKKIAIKYNKVIVGYQILDFIVENKVVVEFKAVNELTNIHAGQMVSYLKATNCRIGLILNFAKPKLEIKRIKL